MLLPAAPPSPPASGMWEERISGRFWWSWNPMSETFTLQTTLYGNVSLPKMPFYSATRGSGPAYSGDLLSLTCGRALGSLDRCLYIGEAIKEASYVSAG